VERVETLAERFRIFQRGLFGVYTSPRECVSAPSPLFVLFHHHVDREREQSPSRDRIGLEMPFNEPFRVLISCPQRIAFVIRSKGLEAEMLQVELPNACLIIVSSSSGGSFARVNKADGFHRSHLSMLQFSRQTAATTTNRLLSIIARFGIFGKRCKKHFVGFSSFSLDSNSAYISDSNLVSFPVSFLCLANVFHACCTFLVPRLIRYYIIGYHRIHLLDLVRRESKTLERERGACKGGNWKK